MNTALALAETNEGKPPDPVVMIGARAVMIQLPGVGRDRQVLGCIPVMEQDELLRRSFVSVEVNDDFSEATLSMNDGSRLRFCHRVGERWARAEGGDDTLAAKLVAMMSRFRLNAKHLDVYFVDGSRWEAGFRT